MKIIYFYSRKFLTIAVPMRERQFWKKSWSSRYGKDSSEK